MKPSQFGSTGPPTQPEATHLVALPASQFALTEQYKTDLWNPFRAYDFDRTLTWGGIHPRSWILLSQADLLEPVRLNRNSADVDQQQLKLHTCVNSHVISRRAQIQTKIAG